MSAREKQLQKRENALERLRETLVKGEAAREDRGSLARFDAQFSRVEVAYAAFEENHFSLSLLAQSAEDKESDKKLRQEADGLYFDILALHAELHEPPPKVKVESERGPPSVRLPKINLPTFSGEFKLWPTYQELFQSMIHKNEQISKVEKFHYLLSSLAGEARNLLKGILLCEANYDDAYTLLVSRYQNKRKLAFFYWEELQGYQLKGGGAKDLRKLLDTFSENLGLLKNLGFAVDSWDFVLFHNLLTKLDSSVRQKFEQEQSDIEIPSYKCLVDFLGKYCQSLELCGSTNVSKGQQKQKHKEGTAAFTAQVKEGCHFCTGTHKASTCVSFQEKSPAERYTMAVQKKLCINCLMPGHRARECRQSCCSICKKHHHTLLHFPKASNENSSNTLTALTKGRIDKSVLLATAVIEMRDGFGQFHKVRALLDSGSQANFISKSCCTRLRLNPTKSRFSVCGLGVTPSVVMSSVVSMIRAEGSPDREIIVDALVLPQICQDLPVESIPVAHWSVTRGIPLADPGFGQTRPIDILLGAEVFGKILTGGRREGLPGEPTALETWFGWCLLGAYNTDSSASVVALHAVVDHSLEPMVKRFWELDSVPKEASYRSLAEVQVEGHFQSTVYRDESGRMGVALPFKQSEPLFPNSRALAARRLLSLERKLDKDPELKGAYHEFLSDYEQSGHMQLLDETFESPEEGYYIPHHPVVRPESSTTKLRVVFDASAKASNQTSLNDVVEAGPSLQLRILAILLRFRMHRVGFIADIRQMYRQILVREEDRKYQKIVWREKANSPVQIYQLNTVTYGVASSPFLAIRTLHEIAKREGENYPDASGILLRDVYMDDAVSGADSLPQAEKYKDSLTELMLKYKFEWHKWASNEPGLVDQESCGSVELDRDTMVSVKVLGLKWDTKQDTFSFSVRFDEGACTKRSVLSHLARVFDPLGLITPVTFLVKALFQQMWVLGLEWDEPAPAAMATVWKEWLGSLPVLGAVQVPRFVRFTEERDCIQLHGFCDASERGYAAVFYLRCKIESRVRCTLIASKTKVAPIKQLSIPRLELCAAVLMSDLLVYVQEECAPWLKGCRVVAWTDSTTVLHWMQSRAFRFKPFVGHRIGKIQEALPAGTFRYVPTRDNPADVASRGVLPEELIRHQLWWGGPSWLCQDPVYWPRLQLSKAPSEDELEVKRILCGVNVAVQIDLLERISSLPKVLRILAWCSRFKVNCRNSDSKRTGPILNTESQKALTTLILRTQEQVFDRERQILQRSGRLPKEFQSLNLFFDEDGIIRVGGRIRNSDLTYARRFPVLLPRKHKLTELIIRHWHFTYLHPGLQTLHFLLRQRFWILSPRRAIRGVLGKCVQCFRTSPNPAAPKMGDLPPTRVTEARAFSRVGIDFGGPFSVKPVKGRGKLRLSLYICIFVCHATKAVHLELVFDLTSEAFIAALRRFVARRGPCDYINCDNGTNFVGAHRAMKTLMREASETEGIAFHFNPPRAPHFGGLFEAGIKSVKTHLMRAVGGQTLTIEEFLTFTVQVEALLNSRPLWPMSADPNDLEALTPGHFLMMTPVTPFADPDLSRRPLHALSRWQLVQALQQSFWARWRNEYLTTLQQRQKWRVAGATITEGALVVIKEEQVKPRYWELARIESLHPGSDGIARVASVRTARGVFKRPVVRLCPLPLSASTD